MKINGVDRSGVTGIRRGGARAADGKGFSVDTASETHSTAGLSGPASLTAVDSILALQGVDDSTSGRKRGVQQGEQLLRLLDEVRDGLLAGGIPRQTLNRLAMAVSSRGEGFADPKLQSVLDDIELRARVELAKLEQAERPAA